MVHNILVLDDSEGMLKLLAYWLEHAGYSVTTTANPREGLAILRSRQCDLLILDIMMREMNGLELLAQLRADEATSGIPVMLISGSKKYRDIAPAERLLFDDFLAKPFEREAFLGRVEAALGKVWSPI
jgi:CheY-like chemotaxis protein